MTCIAAVVHNGTVYMGGDAAGSNTYVVDYRSSPKVFHVGEFLIGYTSSFRMGQLLQHCFKPPKCGKNVDPYIYMIKKFVPAIHKLFKDGKWEGYRDENDETTGATRGGIFLVGFRGRLFKIEADYQVGESSDAYGACGSGEPYAIGSLYTSHEHNPHNRINLALHAAAKHNPYVRGPFTIERLPKVK